MNLSALSLDRKRNNFRRTNIDWLLNKSFGIIQKLEEAPRFPGDPMFFHFIGKACNAISLTGRRNFYNSGGASISKENAMYKAIGEAVERYCSAFFEFNELPLTCYDDAPFSCINPENFSLYSEEQFNDNKFLFVPFESKTPIRWTPVVDFANGQETHAPAAAVYMPYTYILGDPEPPYLQPISTGLACHTSHERALINAICEIVERDAVMIMWQSMLQFPQIRIETLSDTNYEIVRKLQLNTAKVIMLNITTDNGIPTILSILEDHKNPNSPALIFAGASDPDPEIAARKSLEELPHTRRYCGRLMEYSPKFATDFPNHNNVKDQEQHLHFYCDHANAQYAEFVFGSEKRISFEEIESLKAHTHKETILNLVNAIEKTGERVYYKDLTTTDAKELGFFVLRALIPGYQRLCMGYKNRCLNNTRLKNVPQNLKLFSKVPFGATDNPAPHPYP